MIVKDNEGVIVIDKTLSAGGNDSYSGVSEVENPVLLSTSLRIILTPY